jgi:hypothetical protein
MFHSLETSGQVLNLLVELLVEVVRLFKIFHIVLYVMAAKEKDGSRGVNRKSGVYLFIDNTMALSWRETPSI